MGVSALAAGMDLAAHLDASIAVLAQLRADPVLPARMQAAAQACIGALATGGRVMFCGNGGSAADAQHLAAELVGRFQHDRPAIGAIALTTDSSILTAIGNDFGFERIFARQVQALGRAGDVLVAISSSGRSANLLAAMQCARASGITNIGLTGGDGGGMAALCDIELRIPAAATALVQQAHITLGHVLCGLIEDGLHPRA